MAASDLTAHAIWLLAQGAGPAGLLRSLREYAHQARSIYRADWLGDLTERSAQRDSSSCLSLARSAATRPASRANSSSVMPGRRRSVNTTSLPFPSSITRIGT